MGADETYTYSNGKVLKVLPKEQESDQEYKTYKEVMSSAGFPPGTIISEVMKACRVAKFKYFEFNKAVYHVDGPITEYKVK